MTAGSKGRSEVDRNHETLEYPAWYPWSSRAETGLRDPHGAPEQGAVGRETKSDVPTPEPGRPSLATLVHRLDWSPWRRRPTLG